MKILVSALLSLVLLPVIAVGSTVRAVIGFAPEVIPGQPVVDYLADKSVAYWFLALAVVAITSWTWIFKWMLTQLEQQRNVNAEVQKQLVEYMRADHAAMTTALAQVNAVHIKLLTKLERDHTS